MIEGVQTPSWFVEVRKPFFRFGPIKICFPWTEVVIHGHYCIAMVRWDTYTESVFPKNGMVLHQAEQKQKELERLGLKTALKQPEFLRINICP